jgi:hypothetical protein
MQVSSQKHFRSHLKFYLLYKYKQIITLVTEHEGSTPLT